jgi:serine/threonine protein kinase
VDWWSLGIVAYELLTGWPPFFDKDFDQMCEKILRKPIRFPGKYSISMDAQQLIRGFLERNPSERLGGIRAGGLPALQDHIFFSDSTDWDLVTRGQCRPPFIPLAGPDPADTRNFDTEFTKLSVKDMKDGKGDENTVPSLLDYEGFSFLDEEYSQLLSGLQHEGHATSAQFYDLTQTTGEGEELDDDRLSMD